MNLLQCLDLTDLVSKDSSDQQILQRGGDKYIPGSFSPLQREREEAKD